MNMTSQYIIYCCINVRSVLHSTESVEAHLLHPHAWVRLVSSRLLGLLFAAWRPEDLVAGYQKGNTSNDYLQEDVPAKVLLLLFCFNNPFQLIY